MPQVISKGGRRVEQVSDKDGEVLKAWDDMCILNSAIMLSRGIKPLCNPILPGSPWIQSIYFFSKCDFFFFPLEWLAKVQAGLFLLEAQSDDRLTLLQLCLLTRNTEIFLLGSKLLSNCYTAQKCFSSISQSQILSHPLALLFLYFYFFLGCQLHSHNPPHFIKQQHYTQCPSQIPKFSVETCPSVWDEGSCYFTCMV